MNLALSLRAEILKTKRTAAFYFTLIGAAIVPFLFLLNILSDGLPEQDKTSRDPLNALFKIATEMNGIGIFPLFVVLLCTLLPQIEHKNNTWKQVLTSPKTKADVFMAKYLNVLLLMILFQVATHAFMWLVLLIIHTAMPALNLLHHSVNLYAIIEKSGNAFITILAVSALQFWIGLRCKNFLVPIGIGLALWLTGTLLVFEYHSSLANYFPYSFQIFPTSGQYKPELNQVAWTSFGYALLFLGVGFLDFRRRRMIG